MNFKNAANFEKINKAIENMQNKGGQDDDRFWQPTVDKEGNGYATIRFLPTPAKDLKNNPERAVPWVSLYSHAFKGSNGLWYIENSRTTLKLYGYPEDDCKDPVSEMNSRLWNNGHEDVVRKNRGNDGSRSRRYQVIANIYVIDDPLAPENNGKVFLYRFGKKIEEKILSATKGEFGRPPCNVFDLIEGADFNIRIKKKDGYRNYDESSFDKPSPLANLSDDKLQSIWEEEHELLPFIQPDRFKSYDDLYKRLREVLGDEVVDVADGVYDKDSGSSPGYKPKGGNREEKKETRQESTAARRTSEKKEEPKSMKEEMEDEIPWETDNDSGDSNEDDSDRMSYFEGLAEG